ncbi:MAG TPA: FeoA family protein [Symbiobacteriaceae bacterium]|nr:FeoA family protein [Symbiobacteriaceae bacterium]
MSTEAAPLSGIRVGEQAEVVGLSGERETRWRLMDLGLVAGTRVEVLRVSPLGDPVVYRFRGTTVALRKPDADVVLVRRVPAEL